MNGNLLISSLTPTSKYSIQTALGQDSIQFGLTIHRAVSAQTDISVSVTHTSDRSRTHHSHANISTHSINHLRPNQPTRPPLPLLRLLALGLGTIIQRKHNTEPSLDPNISPKSGVYDIRPTFLVRFLLEHLRRPHPG